MKKNLPSLISVIAFSLPSLTVGRAAERTIILEESLNTKWAHELLSYPFEAAKGECARDSLTLVGPQGPQPVQLTDVELWPGSPDVKSGHVIFVTDPMEPLSKATYTLKYGPKAISSVPAKASDLKILSTDGHIEIQTGKFAARLTTGHQTYDTPVAAKDVPGPLRAIKMPDDSWDGGSRLYGEALVKGWSARLIDSGPVLARVEYQCILEDDTKVTFRAQIVESDNAMGWEVDVAGARPKSGVEFLLGKYPGVKEAVLPKGWGLWTRDRTVPVGTPGEPLCQLSPRTSIAGIFPDSPSIIRLLDTKGAELQLRSRAPGAWADPVKPLTYAGYETWNMNMIPKIWENWKLKRLPVSYASDGTVSLKVDFMPGKRLWSIGNGAPAVGEELNVIKDYVLQWPTATTGAHPNLFLSKEEVDRAWKQATPDAERLKKYLAATNISSATEGYLYSGGDKALGEKAAKLLRDYLARLADFDTMRHAIALAALYDAVIDTEFVTPQERNLYRAQLAYLGYRMADPEMWSMERGYLSGNPNMSAAYTLSLGIIACLIPEHPMAKKWAEYATSWMDKWLKDEVGTNGEWLPEGGHYTQVSAVSMISYAIAAKRAGYHDFLSDPRFKQFMLFIAKQFTPPDPRQNGTRVSPSVGRGTSGETTALFGILARATADSDPDFSQVMQWMWNASGRAMDFSHWDWRLGGFEPMYINPDLPSRKPEWKSELFPGLGVVLRDGLGESSENYLNILSSTDSHRNLDIWTPGVGGIAQWYAYGKPISEAFSFGGGYAERHELLRDGVMLARNWDGASEKKDPFGYYTTTDFESFATLPTLDYVRATYHAGEPDLRDWFPKEMPAWPKVLAAASPTLDWTRQALFVKHEQSTGPHYLVLRDTTAGGQPSMWQFWSLSDKIDIPGEMGNLAHKEGNKMAPARELPLGNRYTAEGQFGVDLEYFVASPSNTPRFTLRYGGEKNKMPQFQDLLHLQLPGDGSYYVVIFPHRNEDAAPAFALLGDGKIIKVTGDFGSDYCFLGKEADEARHGAISFKGTSAVVLDHRSGLALGLGAAGEVNCGSFGLSAEGAASLNVSQQMLIVSWAGAPAGGKVTIKAPGKWSLKPGKTDVNLINSPNGYDLVFAAGQRKIELVKVP